MQCQPRSPHETSHSPNDSTAANNTSQETAERPAFPQALLDHVMAHYQKPADLIGENGMLKQLSKAVFEAALNAEMNQHLRVKPGITLDRRLPAEVV